MVCLIKKRLSNFVKTEINFLKFSGKLFVKSSRPERIVYTPRLKPFNFSGAVSCDNEFFRVCELRKKFCYLIKKVPQNKYVIQGDISTCVEERFNGCDIVRKLTGNEKGVV